jgi:hypothetical protein
VADRARLEHHDVAARVVGLGVQRRPQPGKPPPTMHRSAWELPRNGGCASRTGSASSQYACGSASA